MSEIETTVTYSGMPGAFSEIAALRLFPKCKAIGVARFKQVFEAVEGGSSKLGVLPIENSIAGSVHENYDHLDRAKLFIAAEYYLRVEHHLLVHESVLAVAAIKRVYSHPKALEQCTHFFENNPHLLGTMYADTAGSARYVAESRDPSLAAIASREAATLYGLKILAENLEDDPKNYTRFIVVARQEAQESKATKTSLIFSLPHRPGSLIDALKTLQNYGANLTKLESRPIQGKPFEYRFYIDFEFKEGEIAGAKKAVEELRKMTIDLRALGFYRAASPL